MFSATKYEGVRQSDWLLFEESDISRYSRDNITLAASTVAMPTGSVLGKVSATGKFAAYDNAATDGTQSAVGILTENHPASLVDHSASAIVRFARVAPGGLSFKAGTSAADKAAALIELGAAGILAVREV